MGNLPAPAPTPAKLRNDPIAWMTAADRKSRSNSIAIQSVPFMDKNGKLMKSSTNACYVKSLRPCSPRHKVDRHPLNFWSNMKNKLADRVIVPQLSDMNSHKLECRNFNATEIKYHDDTGMLTLNLPLSVDDNSRLLPFVDGMTIADSVGRLCLEDRTNQKVNFFKCED